MTTSSRCSEVQIGRAIEPPGAVEGLIEGEVDVASPPIGTPNTRRTPVIGIVEDDPRLLGIVADLLEDEGYTVAIRATSSDDFLAMLRRIPIDVAIIDLVLGGMEDGVQSVVRPLQYLRPEIDLVVFSSLFDPLQRREIESSGCRWVEKAMGPEALLDVVSSIVRASHGRPQRAKVEHG